MALQRGTINPEGWEAEGGSFRLSESFPCCEVYIAASLRLTTRILYLHARWDVQHTAYKYGVPAWVVERSLMSVDTGYGIPDEVIAEYAAKRLRGKAQESEPRA